MIIDFVMCYLTFYQVPLHIIAAIVSIVFVIAVALHGRQVEIILALIIILIVIFTISIHR